MSKSIIGDQLWAELTEGQKIDAVLKGHATLKQMTEGLLDGSDKLRRVCEESLAQTAPSFENLPVGSEPNIVIEPARPTQSLLMDHASRQRRRKPTRRAVAKQRFGLPEGFVPRLQRFGRGVLLELNVYRLPNGQEFIPSVPVGTLGTRQHLYALLTSEQYMSGTRGSVYVRSDGRIFDYSIDANPVGDFFDTGYTIYDLERTGSYAPVIRKRSRKKRKKVEPAKHRRAAAAGASAANT